MTRSNIESELHAIDGDALVAVSGGAIGAVADVLQSPLRTYGMQALKLGGRIATRAFLVTSVAAAGYDAWDGYSAARKAGASTWGAVGEGAANMVTGGIYNMYYGR
jgi:hypothetical protein